ncbi:hypothetical protein GMSM_08520 [Geomonas sp. Red276]
MSISSVSQTGYNPYYQLKDDFSSLSSALQSGSVTDAQTACATLKSDTSSQSSDSNNPMNRDIQSLGDAISSGDLTSAQSTLAEIEKHLKGHGEFVRQQIEMQSLMQDRDASNQASSSSADGASSTDTTTTGTMQTDFQALASALKSGNLEDAQKAFAQIQEDSGTQDGIQHNDPFSKDLQSLGSALKSGNLSDAQKMFSQMQEKMANGPQGMPPGPPPESASSNSGSSASDSTTSASATDTIGQDFQALASELSSGSLEDAQKAFSTLESDLGSQQSSDSTGSGQVEHHHHHHGPPPEMMASSTSSTGSTDSATSASDSTSSSSSTSAGYTMLSALSSYQQSGYSFSSSDNTLISSTAYL